MGAAFRGSGFIRHLSFSGLFFLVVCCLLFSSFARAQQDTDWLINPQHDAATVRLFLTGEQNEVSGNLQAALQVKLKGDWKTYWRSPGDGGVAPKLDWSGSENIKDIIWQWPVPERFELLGLETFGYKKEVTFPLTIIPENPAWPVVLKGRFRLASCTTLCILTDFDINLSFDPNTLQFDADKAFIHSQALARVPQPATVSGLTVNAVNRVEQQAQPQAQQQAQQQVQLQVIARSTVGWKNPDVIVDGSDEFSFSRPVIRRDDDGLLMAVLDVSSWSDTSSLTGKKLNITLINGDRASESAHAVKAIEAIESNTETNLFYILALAVLGGLILNVMPCVLPVLGLKLSTIIQSGGKERRTIRLQFLASAVGIIFSFWVLAAFLLSLKSAGAALGWGVQFQNPWFLGALLLLTLLFAISLLGLLDIRLPVSVSSWLAVRGDSSLTGHFVQGMFATVLATPCTAPFLGTAVSFALAANSLTLLLIFTALGLGLALPWLLVAAFPACIRLLPKPGKWMNSLKLIFGVMLFATALWLLSLLKNHLSVVVLLSILFLIVIFVSALLLKKVLATRAQNSVNAGALIAGLLCSALAITAAGGWIMGLYQAVPVAARLDWKSLDADKITAYVDAGNIVFVDVTADWCITCKANKLGVLDRDPVYRALKQESVVLMQGDWTQPDPKVTRYLQRYGRYGVPFNIVYGPGAPNGIELPVLLSHSEVLNALNLAAEIEG